MTITCGWCGRSTEWETTQLDPRCDYCGHENPQVPWEHRGQTPPQAPEAKAGRPRLDPSQVRQRIRIARKELGADATNAALAERLGIDERTLGRWQKLAG